MENQEILDMNLAGSFKNSSTKTSILNEKSKLFLTDLENISDEVLIYYGDDRGNIRAIDVSWVLKYPDSRRAIEKTPYFPTEKASFIPKRKGNYKIDKIGESLI